MSAREVIRPGRRAVRAAGLALALAGAACDHVPADAVQRCDAAVVLPAAVATDVLFVIDDSGSMSEEQANLAQNLGAFIDTLAASAVQNDFRIGVTTTSLQSFAGATAYASGPAAGVPFPAGALVAIQTDAAGDPIPGALVYDAAAHAATGGFGGHRILDRGSPTLVEDFKANVRVGLNGANKEQPFRVARLALSDRLADANQSFLRPGARLAVIFVSDEDDCSDSAAPFLTTNPECHDRARKAADLDPVADFAAFLLGPIGGELRDVSVGAIAGFDPRGLAPSCGDRSLCADTACGTAYDEGDRYAALVTALGGVRMRLGSICDASFRDSLTRFAQALAPSTVPLSGAPADWRMLAVTVTPAAGGSPVPCRVAAAETPAQATADAIYTAPAGGRPAALTFQNGCALSLGDRIDVHLVCAQ